MILSDQNDYKPNKMTVFYKDKFISQKLGQYIYNSLFKNNDKIAIICIGSDRSTGDALGPITGSLLSKRNQLSFNVFGTLDYPIHAMNLKEELKNINEMHFDSTFIAVDACLGKINSVGNITASTGPLKPGLAFNKNLPEVGQMHLTGIVNIASPSNYLILQNTRLNIVMKQAELIAQSFFYCDYLLSKSHNTIK